MTSLAGKVAGGRPGAANDARNIADLRRTLESWARILHLDIDGKFERSRVLLTGLGMDAKAGLAASEARMFADLSVAARAKRQRYHGPFSKSSHFQTP